MAACYDAIIIGSGMGGLTAAALLSRRGLKTILFEKQKQVGGYVVSFRKDGFTIDATGSFIGGCERDGAFDQILEGIGARGDLEFIPVQHIRNGYPGFEIHLREGGFGSYLDALRRLFPEEEKGLETYRMLVNRIGAEVEAYSNKGWKQKILFPLYFRNLIRFHRATHAHILDRLFRGGEVKLALHTLPASEPPSRLSFLFVATLISKALEGGVFYPKGGMGRVSQVFSNALQRLGGEVCLGTEVDRIWMKDGRAAGIETKDGRRFEAPLVISDINPNLLAGMLPERDRRRFLRRSSGRQYSLSAFILYVATDLDLKALDFPCFHYVRFLSDLEEEDRILQRGDFPEHPTMIVSVPTLLDASLAPPGRHLIKILVPAPYGSRVLPAEASPSDYLRAKEDFASRILGQLQSALLPPLKGHLLFYEAATPWTLRRYTGNELGCMYGLASTPEQFGNGRPSQESPIPGLFRVGHYTRPSHGIVGASLSGLFAARAILGKFQFPSPK